MKKILTVCLFGTYFANYVRNRVIKGGLLETGVTVTEVHKELERVQLNSDTDYSVLNVFRRVTRMIASSIFFVSQYKKIAQSDVILVLYPGHLSIVIAWFIARFYKKPLVFDAYTSIYDAAVYDRQVFQKNSIQAKIIYIFERFLLNLPDVLLVDTKQMKLFIHKEYGIPEASLFVIPVGADADIYIPAAKKSKTKNITVLFFGGYNPLQGTEYIAQAAGYLQKEKNIFFKMIGDGISKKQVMDYVLHNKIRNITFVGHLPEKRLVKEIQDCSIMLGIFSYNQIALRTIPSKVYAALSCKKPLITARLPAVQDVLTHKDNVYFCEPKNARNLAHTIRILASDSSLREKIAVNGYQFYRQHYTQEKIGRTLLNSLQI